MPAITEELLKSRIKENPTGVYLICGEESFLVKSYTEKLSSAAVSESFRDFNLRVFDGDSASLSDIYESVMAVPMMAQSKCVLVKDFPLYDLSDSETELLKVILQENPEDNCLIFSYPSGNPQKKFTEVKKLFTTYGYLVDFSKKEVSDIRRMIESGAKKRGKVLERQVTDYFINNVGTDLNLLSNELDKLCAYAKNDVISKSDIDEISTKSVEAKVFDMVKDLVYGRFDSAFHKLSLLFANREDEYMILGAMISQYTDIYRAKAVKSAGENYSVLSSCYESYKKSSFKLENAGRMANSFSFEAINNCLEILEKADTELKTTPQKEHNFILEKTIVSLARAGR